MVEFEGIILHIGGLLVIAGIYAIINVGLNVHYGHTGLFNIGIAAFFALGAYTASISGDAAAKSRPLSAIRVGRKFGVYARF